MIDKQTLIKKAMMQANSIKCAGDKRAAVRALCNNLRLILSEHREPCEPEKPTIKKRKSA